MADNFFLQSIRFNGDNAVRQFHLEEGGLVQQYIDSECLRLCADKVPLDKGALKQSGITNTIIGSGEIKYRTPYARRWYYMPANFQGAPERGNYWFARMKQQYAANIKAGAQRIAQGG